VRAIEAETFTGYGGLRQVELPKPQAAKDRMLVHVTAAKFLSLCDGAQYEHLHRVFRAITRDDDSEKSHPALSVQCCPELK
jgi:hypothetical protein